MKKLLSLLILNSAFLIFNSFCLAQNKNIDSLQALLKNDKPDTNRVNHLSQLTYEYQLTGDFEKGLNYGIETLELARKLGYRKEIANASNAIGNMYLAQGDYPKAIDYYLKALKLDEELQNKKGIATRLGNIGLVYEVQAEYQKALEYYFKALKLDEELENKYGIAIHLGNIGIVYDDQAKYTQALNYFFKAQRMYEALGLKTDIAINLGNIGNVYEDQGDYISALDYDFKALKIAEELGDKNSVAINSNNIGSIYTTIGKYKEAEKYLKRALAINDSIGAMDYLRQTEEHLSQLYDTIGRYEQALIHYKKAIALKDTMYNQENKKQLVRKEMNYEFDKKEAATKATHDREMAVAEAEKKKQQFILFLVSCFLLLVFLFGGFIFRSLRITRTQKNIIELQKNEVSQQKEIVEKQKEKIIDSITYAQRIQQSILMEESEIQNYLPECFIYFQPKDIVSGDFYWFSVIAREERPKQSHSSKEIASPAARNDVMIIAAVDCTGHGVPGAFMSMIGNTLLNQIVNEKHITKPSEILRTLNLGVYEALHQKKEGALSDDGMDIALCAIDYKNNEIQFAGAQNPLYVVYDNKIEIVKADIHGIGGGGMIARIHDPIKKEFTNHVFSIKKGMSIYLFSDGYCDQFGGDNRKKFGTQKFKELLLSIQPLSMQKQKEMIAATHSEWKGDTAQIDDILVMGIRI